MERNYSSPSYTTFVTKPEQTCLDGTLAFVGGLMGLNGVRGEPGHEVLADVVTAR